MCHYVSNLTAPQSEQLTYSDTNPVSLLCVYGQIHSVGITYLPRAGAVVEGKRFSMEQNQRVQNVRFTIQAQLFNLVSFSETIQQNNIRFDANINVTFLNKTILNLYKIGDGQRHTPLDSEV
ncbi:hypothetical protein LSH36_18g08012 [Paralvinella palmiformis]|uniref:Uncharacterized protein n=1 Tax=Paralvinella palmiformis TaxID=53620 RepID=A0AAD9KBJ5_9ANNE|nr:hypothetical protein LSH36_18g08012 [Paralvinella palmiformis]